MITPEEREQMRRDATVIHEHVPRGYLVAHRAANAVRVLLDALDESEAENARLRALLAEDVELLEELDAAWGGAGGAGS